MSLESQLTKLNKHLDDLVPALLTLAQRENAPTAEAAADPKPESSPTTEETAEQPTAQAAESNSTEDTASAPGDADASTGSDESAVTMDMVREKLIEVREQEGGNDKPIEIMKKFGAASLGKIKEDEYQGIIDACDEILL